MGSWWFSWIVFFLKQESPIKILGKIDGWSRFSPANQSMAGDFGIFFWIFLLGGWWLEIDVSCGSTWGHVGFLMFFVGSRESQISWGSESCVSWRCLSCCSMRLLWVSVSPLLKETGMLCCLGSVACQGARAYLIGRNPSAFVQQRRCFLEFWANAYNSPWRVEDQVALFINANFGMGHDRMSKWQPIFNQQNGGFLKVGLPPVIIDVKACSIINPSIWHDYGKPPICVSYWPCSEKPYRIARWPWHKKGSMPSFRRRRTSRSAKCAFCLGGWLRSISDMVWNGEQRAFVNRILSIEGVYIYIYSYKYIYIYYMYIYTYSCTYLYTFVNHIYICIFIHIFTSLYTCVNHIYIYINIYIFIYICIFIHIFPYLYTCVNHIYIYTYIYIYMLRGPAGAYLFAQASSRWYGFHIGLMRGAY